MIRRPPISTLSSSSAASDVYKRQVQEELFGGQRALEFVLQTHPVLHLLLHHLVEDLPAVAPAVLCPVHGDVGVADQRCLLYTSDAADEEDSVDLGGRRII